MRDRAIKRVVWLTIPVVSVMALCWILLGPKQSGGMDPSTRGSQPLVGRGVSLMNPATWPNALGFPGDLMDAGMDAVKSASFSPWKDKDYYFGHPVKQLKYSHKPEDQAEYQRLLQLAREWRDRVLARYPSMALPAEKVLVPEKNGLKQLDDLLKRLAAKYPDSLLMGLPLDSGPLSEYSRRRVERQREVVDELQAIGLMPESSALGIDAELWGSHGVHHGRMAAQLLVTDARLAVEQRDVARALDSIRAAMGITNQLGMLDRSLMGTSLDYIRYHVFSNILPELPAERRDLTAWEDVLFSRQQTPAELADAMRATWSKTMSGYLLTNLSHPGNPATPHDADVLVESYTKRMEAFALHAQSLDPEAPMPFPPPASIDHLSPRSQELAKRSAWWARTPTASFTYGTVIVREPTSCRLRLSS